MKPAMEHLESARGWLFHQDWEGDETPDSVIVHDLAALLASRELALEAKLAEAERHVPMLRGFALELGASMPDVPEGATPIHLCGEIGKGINAVFIRNRSTEADRDRLAAQVKELRETIGWALGERGDFPYRKDGDGAYWWRKELRRRVASTADPQGDK